MAAEVSPRRHNSPLRQAQAAATRLRIIEAAHAEFEARGYEGTRIEDIAAQAGVAVPTVYKTFTNKRNLLTAAVTTAMTGGPDGPVDRQAWFQEQLDAPTAEQQLQQIARNARRLNDRAAHLLELVRATAARDSEIATLWQEINNERLTRASTSAQRLAAKTALRTSVPEAAHTLWALTVPELYVLHVTQSDRRPDTYQDWLADVLIAVLLAHLDGDRPRMRTGQRPGCGRRMTGVECRSAAGRPRQAIAAGLLLSVVTVRWPGGVACCGPARCRPSRRAAARCQ